MGLYYIMWLKLQEVLSDGTNLNEIYVNCQQHTDVISFYFYKNIFCFSTEYILFSYLISPKGSPSLKSAVQWSTQAVCDTYLLCAVLVLISVLCADLLSHLKFELGVYF
jgi:hypothetical protein